MNKYFYCTTCPLECELNVSLDAQGGVASIAGNRCPRGEDFARQEIILPLRVLTTTVRLIGGQTAVLLPVRSDCAFALARHRQAVLELNRLKCRAPVRMGEVVAGNIAGTGANMLAACDAE